MAGMSGAFGLAGYYFGNAELLNYMMTMSIDVS